MIRHNDYFIMTHAYIQIFVGISLLHLIVTARQEEKFKRHGNMYLILLAGNLVATFIMAQLSMMNLPPIRIILVSILIFTHIVTHVLVSRFPHTAPYDYKEYLAIISAFLSIWWCILAVPTFTLCWKLERSLSVAILFTVVCSLIRVSLLYLKKQYAQMVYNL
jgi:hypothetical protein